MTQTTAKTVKNYIIFNLVSGAILLITIFGFVFDNKVHQMSEATHKTITPVKYMLSMLAIIVFIAIIIIILWLLYRLIYGFLLRRLKKNYHELEKIEY